MIGELLNQASSRRAGFCVLFSLMMMSSGPGYAEWVEVESQYQLPGLHTIYVDPDTIHREGHLVKLLQLTDYRWMQGGPKSTPRFLSTTTNKQFDCEKPRLRLLAFTEFPRRMASGRPAEEYVDPDRWLPVQPDSIDQALWELACAKR
jgi:hypothetical protein